MQPILRGLQSQRLAGVAPDTCRLHITVLQRIGSDYAHAERLKTLRMSLGDRLMKKLFDRAGDEPGAASLYINEFNYLVVTTCPESANSSREANYNSGSKDIQPEP